MGGLPYFGMGSPNTHSPLGDSNCLLVARRVKVVG